MKAKGKFKNTLMEIDEISSESQAQAWNAKFEKTLLDFASETPCNKNCVEQVEVRFDENGYDQGDHPALVLKNKNISVSEVLNAIDSIPPEVLAAFPDLTKNEWDAIVRIHVLTMMATEGEPALDLGR